MEETRRVRVRTRDCGARPRRQKRLRERGHDEWRSGAARLPPAADARVGVAAARLELGPGLDVGIGVGELAINFRNLKLARGASLASFDNRFSPFWESHLSRASLSRAETTENLEEPWSP